MRESVQEGVRWQAWRFEARVWRGAWMDPWFEIYSLGRLRPFRLTIAHSRKSSYSRLASWRMLSRVPLGISFFPMGTTVTSGRPSARGLFNVWWLLPLLPVGSKPHRIKALMISSLENNRRPLRCTLPVASSPWAGWCYRPGTWPAVPPVPRVRRNRPSRPSP